MIAAMDLRLVLVTPETTLLDEQVLSVRVPLFDGSMGILPGRAPVVGRLGAGELLLRRSGGEESYFVDGGFIQVKGSVVTVLTDRALPLDQIDVSSAQDELQTALSMPGTTDTEQRARELAQQRARRMIALGRR